MYCPNCGKQYKEGTKFCGYCGTKLDDIKTAAPTEKPHEDTGRSAENSTSAPREDPSKKSRRKRKRALWIILIVAICVVVIALVLYIWNNSTDRQFSKHMEAGYASLEDGDCEEAVEEFTAAIEIDPKMVEPYQQLAQAYIQLNDAERAETTFDDARDVIVDTYEDSSDTNVLLDGAEDLYIDAINYYGEKGEPDIVEELTNEITDMLTNEEDIQIVSETSEPYIDAVKEAVPYFVEHDLEIEPTGNLTCYSFAELTSDDGEAEKVWEPENLVVNIVTVPSDESGYVDTIISIVSEYTEYGDSSFEFALKLYDYYTGEDYSQMETNREADEDSDYDRAVTLIGTDGETYDIYYSFVNTTENGKGVYETVHHPEEYDGTVFALFGSDSATAVDENGLNPETGNKVIDGRMADIGDWEYVSNGSNVNENDLTYTDIHFFKEGVEGEFTPYFVEEDLEYSPIGTLDDSQKISVDIVADDGTSGTADLYVAYLGDFSVSDSSESEWSQNIGSEYRLHEITIEFQNEQFEDGEDHEYSCWLGFFDYYTGNIFMIESFSDQEGTQVSDRNTFTAWDGEEFEYWIEYYEDADSGIYSYNFCCPDWYDGAVFYMDLTSDASAQEGLLFQVMDIDAEGVEGEEDGEEETDEEEVAEESDEVMDDAVSEEVTEEVDEEEVFEETDAANIDAFTPEEFMTYVYATYFIPEIKEESFWDECIADSSKDPEGNNKSDYIQMVTDRVNQRGLECLNYKAESSKDMGDGNYSVIGSLTYMMSGEEQTRDVTDYVIIEGSHYKVLPEALSKTGLLIPTQVSGVVKILSCDVEYTSGDDSITLTCTIENSSSSNVQFGWSSAAQAELELSDGKILYTDLPVFSKINAGHTETFTMSFDNVNADIQKLTIHSANVLNSQGLPSDFSGGSDITATF